MTLIASLVFCNLLVTSQEIISSSSSLTACYYYYFIRTASLLKKICGSIWWKVWKDDAGKKIAELNWLCTIQKVMEQSSWRNLWALLAYSCYFVDATATRECNCGNKQSQSLFESAGPAQSHYHLLGETRRSREAASSAITSYIRGRQRCILATRGSSLKEASFITICTCTESSSLRKTELGQLYPRSCSHSFLYSNDFYSSPRRTNDVDDRRNALADTAANTAYSVLRACIPSNKVVIDLTRVTSPTRMIDDSSPSSLAIYRHQFRSKIILHL